MSLYQRKKVDHYDYPMRNDINLMFSKLLNAKDVKRIHNITLSQIVCSLIWILSMPIITYYIYKAVNSNSFDSILKSNSVNGASVTGDSTEIYRSFSMNPASEIEPFNKQSLGLVVLLTLVLSTWLAN